MALAIRLYKESDRERIRRICYETGYMGESVAWYWKDPESFADMFISYYTDKEPESFLVAVDDKDEVVGYLSGCVDSTKADDPVAIGAKIAFLNLGLLSQWIEIGNQMPANTIHIYKRADMDLLE